MKNQKVELGDMAEDTISGLRGIVVGKHDFAFGGPQFTIQPPAKDGKVPDVYMADAERFKVVKKLVAKGQANGDGGGLENGDLVKHRITGLEGVVTSVSRWLYGCDTVGFAPKQEKDGKPADRVMANSKELELLQKHHLPIDASPSPSKPKKPTGGPVEMPRQSRL